MLPNELETNPSIKLKNSKEVTQYERSAPTPEQAGGGGGDLRRLPALALPHLKERHRDPPQGPNSMKSLKVLA